MGKWILGNWQMEMDHEKQTMGNQPGEMVNWK